MLSTEMAARAQFGFTIAFHILFPTLNIGLAAFLSICEGLWLKTGNIIYYQWTRFWTKIFALTFGMGVVSGIVMSYELGTNFAHFSEKVGGVLGPLFSYEILSAFFLEAGFLGIMVFGWQRVTPRLHYLATLLVAIGTTISAFWIMAANSWMQTPAGYTVDAQGIHVSQWWNVIFNPSFIPRYLHMLLASYVSTALVISGVCAWYILQRKFQRHTQFCLKFSLYTIAILLPLQIAIGDWVGLKVHEYQPIKTAAIEANWHTQKAAPLVLLGLPDVERQQTHYSLAIPKLASLINTHHLEGELVGLDTAPQAEWPAVNTVFFSFRIMVGCGLFILALAIMSIWQLVNKRQLNTKLVYMLLAAAPLGFVATLAGWMTAEIGRQPWAVYGLVRTAEAVSPVGVEQVLTSLLILIVTYGLIFGFYLLYLLKLINKGPISVHVNAISVPAALRRPL